MKARFFLLIGLLGLLAACEREKEQEPITPGNYEFGLTVRNQDYTENVVLAGLGFTGLTSVENLPSWVTGISLSEESFQGDPVALVEVKADRDMEESRSAVVTLKTTRGDNIKLELTQWPALTNGENDVYKSKNVDFEKDWASAQKITIFLSKTSVNGRVSVVDDVVSLPWDFNSSPLSWLPRENGADTREVAKMIKSKDDWSLVFNMTGIEDLPNRNYFGLYNRYTGTLRVFFYFTAEMIPSNSTNDHMWSFAVSEDLAEHFATQFALPYDEKATVDFKRAASKPVLVSPTTDEYNPFTTQGQTVPKVGWWAFDLNMSALRGHDFFQETSATSTMDISLFTSSTQQVFLNSVLRGSLNGLIDGSVQLSQLAPKTTATWGRVLLPIINTGSAFFMNTAFVKDIAGYRSGTSSTIDVNRDRVIDLDGNADNLPAMPPQPANQPEVRAFPVAMLVSLLVGTGLSLLGKYLESAAQEKADVGDLGSISLDAAFDLNAVMATSGAITSPTTNVVPAISMTKGYLKEFNDDNTPTSLGKGIWNLLNHPVVYIVKDAYWYENNFNSFSTKKEYPLGGGTQYPTDVYSYDLAATKGSRPGLRLITFLDPTSVGGVTFNSDLFGGEFSQLNVYLSYGVYPGSDPGYTDVFRHNAGMDFPHSWRLSEKSKFDSSTDLKMVKRPHTDTLFTWADISHQSYRDVAGYRLASQNLRSDYPGLERRFYGPSMYYNNPYATPFDVDEVQFVYDPQIYVPFDDDGHKLYDPQVPDIVVTASIIGFGKDVKDQETAALVNTLRFLPKIEFISWQDLPRIYQEIKGREEKIKGVQGVETVWKEMLLQINHIEQIKNAFDTPKK